MQSIDEDTPTFVISLLDEASEHRRRQVECHLDRAGFRNATFVRAKSPDSEQFAQRGYPSELQGRWRTDLRHLWGSAACTLSHLQFYGRGTDELPVIILEDDVTIHPDFFHYLQRIEFPREVDWDICHLGLTNPKISAIENPERVVTPQLVRCPPNEVACTHSYILRRPILDRLLPMREEVDWQLSRCTESIRSFVIDHDPKLVQPDFQMPSVRTAIDHVAWHRNNPGTA
ncbi:glycosyltransferase family 25 protein [Rhodopirellula sp. JC740]|uniref:Glycosyltransferase family 25 protein n=1 Tax=Rhodopirellula halodulae TaxID=2894198 RepID=A0ABS8NEG2_9BACT|nr:glycosyltransferase family 25 protein [Rhodopirellula sp. JC740]MCC9641942.1 glycosyltransferase family 25 protein [Rhodopirellula sp. JC740]